MAAHTNITFRIYYTSLFQTLPGPCGELMRQKQGKLVSLSINAQNNLTMKGEYARRQNRFRLQRAREPEWRGRGEGREFV
jgi:hypothetical protein